MRVGYLGPAGTYSEEALRASSPAGVEEVPFPTIYDAVMAVHDRKVDRSVVPIENSSPPVTTMAAIEVATTAISATRT